MRSIIVVLVAAGCGSGFSGSDGQVHAGDGGAAAVAVSASGSGGNGAETVAEVSVAASSSASSTAVASSSASTAASSSVASSSSSSAASSSSSGGGGLTPEQMYAMFCDDTMPVAGTDHCDKNHANCHCVAGNDAACPFVCSKYKYCCTLWLNPYQHCTITGGMAWMGVGATPHSGSQYNDATYCSN